MEEKDLPILNYPISDYLEIQSPLFSPISNDQKFENDINSNVLYSQQKIKKFNDHNIIYNDKLFKDENQINEIINILHSPTPSIPDIDNSMHKSFLPSSKYNCQIDELKGLAFSSKIQSLSDGHSNRSHDHYSNLSYKKYFQDFQTTKSFCSGVEISNISFNVNMPLFKMNEKNSIQEISHNQISPKIINTFKLQSDNKKQPYMKILNSQKQSYENKKFIFMPEIPRECGSPLFNNILLSPKGMKISSNLNSYKNLKELRNKKKRL